MNVSQYVIYYPFRIAWHAKKLIRTITKKPIDIAFYCGTPVDYIVARGVLPLLPHCRIIAKNKKVKQDLFELYGVENCTIYPAFPDIVLMARHVARKFPEKKMIKYGMRHGAYHFKDFVSSARYNAFDNFFVTSEEEVRQAKEKDINNCVAVGFPKLDDAFTGKITHEHLKKVKQSIPTFDSNKKTIIFTATWDKSNMSAVALWSKRLSELTKDYNVLVTLHPWVSKGHIEQVKNTENVHYIYDKDILPYLMISDVMIGDISSIIAEFCALDKPIVTYKTPDGKRTSQEILNMLNEISYRVDTFEEMTSAIKTATLNPQEHSQARAKHNKIMFDELDGKAGERLAHFINEKIKRL